MAKRETTRPLERSMKEILSKIHGAPIGYQTFHITKEGTSSILAKDIGDQIEKAYRELGGGYLAEGVASYTNVFVTLASFMLGILMLSPTITGNAIANLSSTNSTILGAILVITSILVGFMGCRKK